ncbi:MAG: gliding motility-associated C-terminal domain-containing protein [Bacteroidota bacterium]|nr:gliding motility-associated C-terminal domain-containing protein [Bacteroidota bacterium]
MMSFIALTFAHAQPNVLISDDDWTSNSTNGACNCATNFNNGSVTNFFDTGNNTNSYSSNENEVITFCPDASGTKMVAVFGINAGYSLDIDPTDTLFVYDGIQTSSPLLAKINNTTFPNGVNLPASWSNTSGCLTFQFVSDAMNEGTGWDANLSCANLIQPFSNHILGFINGEANGANDSLNDLFPEDTGYIDICLGDTVTFVADPYFPYEPGGDSASTSGGGYMQSSNYTVLWELSDGTTYNSNSFNFIPTSRNGFFVSLRIEDSQGQFQYSFCKVRVSTIPNFSSCNPLDSPICLGNTTQLIGGVTNVDTAGVDPVSANFPIGGVFGTQTYLPDGSGINYTTDINISGFTPGATVQNSNDIEKVCFEIEHSYLGDLEMMLTCPNGQSMNMFNSYSGFGGGGLFPGGFNGGTDFLGGAYDNNTGNIGVCEEYCFSMSANALPSWANGYPTTAATGPSTGTMVTPGLYQPEQNFTPALQGCPINGTWTLTVRDNLSIDDGFICEWGIYFNSALNPNSEIYAPSIVTHNWLSDPSIISNQDTNITVQPTNLGVNPYTFSVEDNFGCTYDTTITVITQQPGFVESDVQTCNDFYQFNNNYVPTTGFWTYTSNSGTLSFNDTNSINPYVASSDPGFYNLNLIDLFCQDTLQHVIHFLATPSPHLPIIDSICLGENYSYSILNSNNDFNYAWINNIGDTLMTGDSLYIDVNSLSLGITDLNLIISNQCDTLFSDVSVSVKNCQIPNIITPNGDLNNDVFYTHYAEIYPDVTLIVYNRWGRLVFEKSNYRNDWNGVKNNGTTLPDGTYFYILSFDNNQEKKEGIIQIVGNSN